MPTTSKLTLMNGALAILGQRKISSLTEATESRRLLDDHYDKVVEYMLMVADWNFAGVSVSIEASVDVEPSFGYGYAFEKPDDWLRTVQLSANDRFFPILGPGEYVDEAAYWNADCNPLYARYISNATDAGLDYSMWPQTFVLAVEYELAKRTGPHLTTMSATAKDELKKDAKRALADAKSKDAANQAPGRLARGRLMRARAGAALTYRWRGER